MVVEDISDLIDAVDSGQIEPRLSDVSSYFVSYFEPLDKNEITIYEKFSTGVDFNGEALYRILTSELFRQNPQEICRRQFFLMLLGGDKKMSGEDVGRLSEILCQYGLNENQIMLPYMKIIGIR